VLRALSFLPPLEALQQIPETFLEQLRLKYGDDCSKAASILRLNRLHWQTNESSDIVRDALALEKDYPEHMLRLFDYIDSAGKSGPHLEAFLAELVNQTPPVLEPGLVKRAMDLLVKLVERRPATTELPDPAIRQSGAPMTGMIRS
jgi:hypothetical protein